MKIIIVNYRYFISGGPERYLFNIMDLLEKNGHEVIPFSIRHTLNKSSAFEKYFIEPVGKADEVYFSEYKKSDLKTIVRSFSRMFYSFEAKRKLDSLIKNVKPDLIYVLHYQNKISASIFDAAKKNKIPVVHRISDFGQICANALFYRPNQKDICERCLTGSRFNAVINKCVYNSYVYSAIKAASLKFQEINGLTKKVQAFVVPSKFTLEKLSLHGFPKQQLVHIPSFFNFEFLSKEQEISYQPFALFIGRIEPEKGVLTMIKAFEDTSFNLKIIGFSNAGFEEELKDYLKDKNHRIEFLGKMGFAEIQTYLSRCLFTLVPSECYDNFPNSLLESFAFKKCAIATNTGGLKELVIDQETGLLFEIKDIMDLKKKITHLFADETLCKNMGENAFNKLNEEYSAQKHYQKLNNLFENVVTKFQTLNNRD